MIFWDYTFNSLVFSFFFFFIEVLTKKKRSVINEYQNCLLSSLLLWIAWGSESYQLHFKDWASWEEFTASFLVFSSGLISDRISRDCIKG